MLTRLSIGTSQVNAQNFRVWMTLFALARSAGAGEGEKRRRVRRKENAQNCLNSLLHLSMLTFI